MRLVSFNLGLRGFLDYLTKPNIYRTRLTSLREHKSLVLGLVIGSKVSSFRRPKFLAECFIIYVCCLSVVLCYRQIFICFCVCVKSTKCGRYFLLFSVSERDVYFILPLVDVVPNTIRHFPFRSIVSIYSLECQLDIVVLLFAVLLKRDCFRYFFYIKI